MRNLIGLLLLLGAAGCYTPAAFGGGLDRSPDPRYDPRPSHDIRQDGYPRSAASSSMYRGRSLRASVWFDEFTGYAAFDVNRPAHVAIFALRPLGAIEMIYPSWGRGISYGHTFRAGQHRVRTDSRLYHLTRSRSAFGSYDSPQATYIVLVASDRPLQLQGLMATGTLPWLNTPAVTWNPFLATDALVREIVPRHGATDWTTAYHVVWPEAALNRYDGRVPRTRVVCPGNHPVWVSSEALRNGWFRCPDSARRPNRPVGPGDRARPRSPATPPVRATLPNRPRPTDWRGATPTDGSQARGRSGTVKGAVERPRTPASGTPRSAPPREVRPRVPNRPTATPASRPQARPESRPARRPEAKPAPRPATRPAARPAPRPKARPAPRPAPAPRPRPSPKPRPKPDPKPGGGGG